MKLTHEEMDLLKENREIMRVAEKLLEHCIDRHKDKLFTEPVSANGFELTALRLKIDGMRSLVNDFRQTTTNSKS